MRLVSFRDHDRDGWGDLRGNVLVPADAAAGTLRDALRTLGPERIADALSGPPMDAGGVTLLPPVPNSEKILCVGLNFDDHVREMNRAAPEFPVIFPRFPDSLVGHDAPLMAPRESAQFDFEGELAVVIGRTARYVAPERAMDHVFGYSLFNDGSVRDFQRHTHQFTPGKNFPRSGSFGPAIVPRDELGDLDGRAIRTRLNGVLVQESTLGELVFSVPQVISYVSRWTELRPGDVIAMGTPGGVGSSRTPPLWMYPGDRCEIEIDGVGLLANTIAEEADQL
jgi:2-keto-4-pentenoate hydratase/2-oxohepta-3-ene-1,7-dioic acid hydratase in catechol pathway